MYRIQQVAVLGSGIMGSRIACHIANAGYRVLLLDIVPPQCTAEETARGLDTGSPQVRNRLVNDALKSALGSKPSPLFRQSYASRISTGNFDDDLHRINSCDWIIEAVVERLDVKQSLFERVEMHRKPGTPVTSNTSGIPIALMAAGRSDDFRKHFCGAHFFNPPRYLRLLELIPGPDTDPGLLSFLSKFGDKHLGKTTVLCKDTPAFIANRIGVFGIQSIFHRVADGSFTVEEVDKLTGPVLGRPKSATFRTCDVVGLDTLLHVAKGLYENLPQDESRELFRIPEAIAAMASAGRLGDKTKGGFYKKTKSESGKTEIQALNLQTGEYQASKKVKFDTLEQTKSIDDLRQRLPVLVSGKDKAGAFYRDTFYRLFQYVSHRIPEIADQPYRIDQAMQAGFGWELGPFESWDALGVQATVTAMEQAGLPPAAWVYEMLSSGVGSFYASSGGTLTCFDPKAGKQNPLEGREHMLSLVPLRREATIWKNSGTELIDLGDGVLCCSFKTKMNTIGGEVVEGLNKALDLASENFRGLVIGNESANFSAGANLGLVFMFAVEQEWDEIDLAVRMFQKINMRVRYSPVPVVVAPFGLSLGGGCEMLMHADAVQAHAELYTGLVEFGVGLIPGGGGTKEFALRLSDELRDGDIALNRLRERFLTIGQAKVSTSADEAFDLGFLQAGKDHISMNRDRLLSDAKQRVITLAEEGYVQPLPRKDILVQGKSGIGVIWGGAANMRAANFISDHDELISRKLAHVLCGGELSSPTLVSENYLLDLEREAFLSLCGEKKTLERIQSILTTGKVLRN
ncbi:MAG: 3-hydroxyacyl-CoA dehydrogenase/enoyl-CoA hydratase family protein [Bacteroidota bacterium]